VSTYKVATNSTGERIWCAGYDMAHCDMPLLGYSDIRDASAEEAALMDKVVWGSDSEADCRKLKELIAEASQVAPAQCNTPGEVG
jgi:hypothetical protein